MEKCTIVVPCYNEEEAIPLFYEATNEALKDMPLEIEYLFVNDGSRDKTLDVLRELSEKDARVHYVPFSRNFGKEAAMYAGLKESTGDYVAIMDADLQDPPELIPGMYEIKEITVEYANGDTKTFAASTVSGEDAEAIRDGKAVSVYVKIAIR